MHKSIGALLALDCTNGQASLPITVCTASLQLCTPAQLASPMPLTGLIKHAGRGAINAPQLIAYDSARRHLQLISFLLWQNPAEPTAAQWAA